MNRMGPILGQDTAVLRHAVGPGPCPQTRLWAQRCQAPELLQMKMPEMLLAQHGHFLSNGPIKNALAPPPHPFLFPK